MTNPSLHGLTFVIRSSVNCYLRVKLGQQETKNGKKIFTHSHNEVKRLHEFNFFTYLESEETEQRPPFTKTQEPQPFEQRVGACGTIADEIPGKRMVVKIFGRCLRPARLKIIIRTHLLTGFPGMQLQLAL